MSKFSSVFNIKKLPMDIGRLVQSPLMLWFRIKRFSPDGKRLGHIKTRGGGVIVSNHISFLDPLIVAACFPLRRMHFVVASDVMRGAVRRALLRGMGCIEIRRDIFDVECIKKCIGLLKKGHLLCVFPQGHISREDDIGAEQLKSGAVLMAIRAAVPIMPVYIKKRGNSLHRQVMVIGGSMNPSAGAGRVPSAEDIAAATDELLKISISCRQTAERINRKEQ